LTSQGLNHQFHDFKKAGVSSDLLHAWLASVSWQTLLNRQGSTWRKLPEPEQAQVVDASTALALMQAHSSVIKRPVVQWPGGRVTVGFEAMVQAAQAGL
jgi:arsenate reductase (glutaredoxin)